MTAVTKNAFPAVSRTDFEAHLDSVAKATAEEAKAKKIQSAKDNVAEQQAKVDDAKSLAAALRALVIAHKDNAHVLTANIALSSVVSYGTDAKYYRDDAQRSLERLQGQLPAEDDDLI